MKVYHNAVENVKVTSKYGPRTHPITGEKGKMHYGTDIISGASNDNLYALEDGYVQKTVTNQSKATTGYGNYIWVRYPRINRSLMYAHCSKILLKKGAKVKKGTPIAIMGSTGASTGKHCHIGMTLIGSDTWLNTDTYNYQPLPEPTPTPVDNKELEEAKAQIKELEEQVNKLSTELALAREEIVNLASCKFAYVAPDNGTYEIELIKDEMLYIK